MIIASQYPCAKPYVPNPRIGQYGVVNISEVTRRVTLSQKQLLEIKSVFESVMNLAANGLFFRAGQVIGKDIAIMAGEVGDPFLKAVGNILVKEGWAESAELDREKATVRGCIEVRSEPERSCNILRGILAEVYSQHYGSKLFCHEIECSGNGAPACVFRIKKGAV